MSFFLLATQRSGTAFLTRVLNAHPDVHLFHDVFLPENTPYNYYRWLRGQIGREPGALLPARRAELVETFLDTLFEPANARQFRPQLREPVRLTGANVKYDALRAECPAARAALVGRLKTTPVIHLVRRNLLRTLCSDLLNREAPALGRQTHGRGKPPPVAVTLKPGRALLEELARRERQIAHYREMLGGNPRVLELAYEDFFEPGTCEADTIRPFVLARILGFLGLRVPRALLATDLVKTNPSDLRALIRNYEAVCETLEGTPYAAFIGEPSAEPAPGPATANA